VIAQFFRAIEVNEKKVSLDRSLVAELPDVCGQPGLVLGQVVDLGLDVLADAGDQKFLDLAVHLGNML
jgi:hypothetical protein